MNDKPSGGAGFKELFKGVADQVAHDLVNLPLDAVREAVGAEKESGKRVGGAGEGGVVNSPKEGVISELSRNKITEGNSNQKASENENLSDSQTEKQLNSNSSEQSQEGEIHSNQLAENKNSTNEFKDVKQQNVTSDDDDDLPMHSFNISSVNAGTNRGDVMRFVYDGLSQKQQAVMARELGKAREEEETKRIGRLRDSLGIQNGDIKKSDSKVEIFQLLQKAVRYGFDDVNIN